jgi:ABC-2 type transport system ATP-binding protein
MIRIEGLTKSYGKVKAVDRLSLTIDKGTVYGFVGPNGAGKSTTMLILATLLAPTSGAAFVNGYNVLKQPQAVRRCIGYMPDFFGVYDHLKVSEYLDFYAATYDIPIEKRKKRINQLLQLVRLEEKREAYVDNLSRGMKQRLGLARCLVHQPEVLILDEPASGLDPRARIELKQILNELRKQGKTILISSHILPELAEMCDHIGVIDNGKLIASGHVSDIYARMKEKKQLKIRLLNDWEKAEALLKSYPFVSEVSRRGEALAVGFTGTTEDQVKLLRQLIADKLPILSLEEREGNLEEIFMALTGEVAYETDQ